MASKARPSHACLALAQAFACGRCWEGCTWWPRAPACFWGLARSRSTGQCELVKGQTSSCHVALSACHLSHTNLAGWFQHMDSSSIDMLKQLYSSGLLNAREFARLATEVRQQTQNAASHSGAGPSQLQPAEPAEEDEMLVDEAGNLVALQPSSAPQIRTF